jgi:hypothetical protein
MNDKKSSTVFGIEYRLFKLINPKNESHKWQRLNLRRTDDLLRRMRRINPRVAVVVRQSDNYFANPVKRKVMATLI